MSQIDFSTFSEDIRSSYTNILDTNSSTNWAVYGYGSKSELKLVETGQGGLLELQNEFEGSKILYAFARVIEPVSQLPRFVLIAWCGEGVQVSRKGLFNSHVNDIVSYFRGFHVQINARHEEDIEPEAIMKKIGDSCGAKYSVQHSVSNSSSGRVLEAIKTDYNNGSSQRAEIDTSTASKTNSPRSSNYNKWEPQALPQSTMPSNAPVKTSPKPPNLKNQLNEPKNNFDKSGQNNDSYQPKPLYQSVSSTYEPIKTDPKPINQNLRSNGSQFTTYVENFVTKPKCLDEILQSSYIPVKTDPKPLNLGYDANFHKETKIVSNQPRPRQTKTTHSFERSTNVSSIAASFNIVEPENPTSYVPIKLHPKPLFSEGVAKGTYVVPEISSVPSQGRASTSKIIRQPEVMDSIVADFKAEKLAQGKIQLDTEPVKSGFETEQPNIHQNANQKAESPDKKFTELDIAPTKLEQSHQDRVLESPIALTATVIYDYEPSDTTEVKLFEGEFITNIVKFDTDWWQGTNSHGQVGLFPANYVELQAKEVADVDPTSTYISSCSAIALFDYDAAETNEITFVTDEIITNIDFITEEWWSGTNSNGEIGLCFYI